MKGPSCHKVVEQPAKHRPILLDDIQAAIRGNRMHAATNEELDALIADFSKIDTFAALATVRAAEQVKAHRRNSAALARMFGS